MLRYAFSSRVPYFSEPVSTNDRDSSALKYGRLLQLTDAIWANLSATPTTVLDLLGVSSDNLARESLRRLVRERDTLLRELVAERKAARGARGARSGVVVGGGGGGGGDGGDMLDVLLSSGLPDADVLYTLVDLFVAGVNTVSTTLEWQLLLCADQPLVQARARAAALHHHHLHHHLPDSTAPHTAAPYVAALTKEVLRAKPPLLLPRMAVTDTSVRGYHVARGTVVYANNWALTHSPSHWLEPSAFRPERWLAEEAAAPRGGAASCKYSARAHTHERAPHSPLHQSALTHHRVFHRGVCTRCGWATQVHSFLDRPARVPRRPPRRSRAGRRIGRAAALGAMVTSVTCAGGPERALRPHALAVGRAELELHETAERGRRSSRQQHTQRQQQKQQQQH